MPSAFPGGALWLLHEPTTKECGILIAWGREAVLPLLLFGKKDVELGQLLSGSQPLTAPWLPGEGFCLAGLGMGPKPLTPGEVTMCPPGAKVVAGHPRLSQALGSVPGPPGQCGGFRLVLCLLLAWLCVAKPLAFWLCKPPPLH